MDLNPSQLLAAGCRKHCVVAAGPGSGKTALLVKKTSRLVKEGVSPEEIMLATFNREAALEMRRRLAPLIGLRSAKALRLGTYHALARQQLAEAGIPVRIANPGQIRKAILTVCEEEGGMDYQEAVRAIETAKSTLDETALSPAELRIAEAYTRLLQRQKLFDFFDILREAVRAIEAERVDVWRLQAVLADEYQDTDPVQHAWLKLHIDAGANMTIVGDDDQSIYGWRHALGYKGMAAFLDEYDAELIPLDVNYRCPENLVQGALALIRNNRQRIEKEIHSGVEGECQLTWSWTNGTGEEAALVAEIASSLPLAVLSRTRAYLDDIEMALATAGVEYCRKDGSSIVAHPAFRALVDLLRMTDAPDLSAAESLLRRVDLDRRSWRQVAQERELSMDPRQILIEGVPEGLGDEHEVITLARYLEEWRSTAEIHPGMAFRAILTWLAARQSHIWKERLELIARQMPTDMPLAEIIREIENLILRATARTTDEDKDVGTILTTIHQAKGMTYDHVWLVGMADWHFPVDGADLEEERRLLYVAMTRARRSVTITSVPDNGRSPFHRELNEILGEQTCAESA